MIPSNLPEKATLSSGVHDPVKTGPSTKRPSDYPVEVDAKKYTLDSSLQTETQEINSVDLNTACPLANADGSGVDMFLKMSPEERMKVMFDRETLESFQMYTLIEKGKDIGVINGWQFLLNSVRCNIFLSSPSAIRSLLSDSHKSTYPGTEHSHIGLVPGTFRCHDQASEVRYRLKKSSNSQVSTEGLLFTEAILREYYDFCELPDLPAFALTCWENKSSKVFDHPNESSIAVSGRCAASLLEQPPTTEEELQKQILKSAESYREPLSGICKNIQHQWLIHWEAASHLLVLQQRFLSSKPLSEDEKQKFPDFFDYHNVTSNLRGLPPPFKESSRMIRKWSIDFHDFMNKGSNSKLILNRIAEQICRLAHIRPFRDGNCRVLNLLLQGLLMTYGYRPVHLDTRYIFCLSPDQIAVLLNKALSSTFPELEVELPEHLKHLAEKLE